MSAHTPGPWAIINTGSINQIVPAMREGMIADLIDNDANAYLIAAAPKLLGIVKLLADFADQAATLDYNEDITLSWISVVVTNARTVIAAAEGRVP